MLARHFTKMANQNQLLLAIAATQLPIFILNSVCISVCTVEIICISVCTVEIICISVCTVEIICISVCTVEIICKVSVAYSLGGARAHLGGQIPPPAPPK